MTFLESPPWAPRATRREVSAGPRTRQVSASGCSRLAGGMSPLAALQARGDKTPTQTSTKAALRATRQLRAKPLRALYGPLSPLRPQHPARWDFRSH